MVALGAGLTPDAFGIPVCCTCPEVLGWAEDDLEPAPVG